MKIAILLDNKVNVWTLQLFEALKDVFLITVFVGERNDYDTTETTLSRHLLTHVEEIGLALHSPFEAVSRLNAGGHRRTDYYYFSLRRYLEGYDAVFSCDITRSAFTLSDLKDKYRFKFFLGWWENIPYRSMFDERIEFMKKRIMPEVDHFLPYTHTGKKALSIEGVPEEKMTVVYPGIDLNKFSPGEKTTELLDRYDIKKGAFVAAYVGQLTSWKGVYNLMYAARVLKNRGVDDVIFVVAGKGAQRDMMIKMIGEMGVKERFRFLDFLPYDRVQEVYNLADVFVLPSYPTMTWQQQFGMVLAEAMGCGKPVISTLSGSIPEVVGGCGLLIPSGDFHALADSLQRLMKDASLRERLGKKARERAEEYFDAAKNSRLLYNVFISTK